jgi:hypothetical protein
MPEMVLQGIGALAKKLAGLAPTPDEWLSAFYGAAYLLAWSPALWQKELGAQAPALDPLAACVKANALLMANTPSYILGAGSAPARLTERATGVVGGIVSAVTNAFARVANVVVNATFADLPNATQNGSALDVAKVLFSAETSLARTFIVRGPPSVGGVVPGDSVDSVLDPKMIPERIATVASAIPALRRDNAAPAPKSFALHDVTFVLCMTQQGGYIAESDKPLRDTARYATDGDGEPQGKVYEVAASLGMPANPPEAQKASGYVLSIEGSTYPSIASIQRQGDQVTLSLLHADVAEEIAPPVQLPGHGRLVALRRNAPERLHLGNRFRSPSASPDLTKGQGDDGYLKDVIVTLYEPGARTPTRLARALDTGEVDIEFVGLDGAYQLRTEGPLTFSHAGPNTPVFGAIGQPKSRVWMTHQFDVEIADGVLLSIDHEPVPHGPFRLLIDPVWMRADDRRSHDRPRRPRSPGRTPVRLVDLLVIHATDYNDARRTASTWVDPPRPHEQTSANYLVARDGTTIKFVDETRAAHHVGEGNQWRQKSSASLPSLNTFSIGIEMARADNVAVLFTENQYKALLGDKQVGTLGLLGLLLGRDPSNAISLRRRGSTSDPDYVDIDIRDTEVIGHCDVRYFRDKRLNRYWDILGGKPDPTLAFEWARLEAEGIGLRRRRPPDPLLGSQPSGPVHQERHCHRWDPTVQWAQQQQEDERRGYDEICAILTGGTRVEPSDPVIRQRVFDDLTKIGYWAGSTLTDGQRRRDGWGNPFQKAITAFRTHFFTGARRTRQDSDEEADYDLDEVTVVWIFRVAECVDQLRNRP